MGIDSIIPPKAKQPAKPIQPTFEVPTKGNKSADRRVAKDRIDSGRCPNCNRAFIMETLYRVAGTGEYYCKACVPEVQRKLKEAKAEEEDDGALETLYEEDL